MPKNLQMSGPVLLPSRHQDKLGGFHPTSHKFLGTLYICFFPLNGISPDIGASSAVGSRVVALLVILVFSQLSVNYPKFLK